MKDGGVPGVAGGDGCVVPLEELGHRRANYFAPAKNDGSGASQLHSRGSDQLHASGGGAREETRRQVSSRYLSI